VILGVVPKQPAETFPVYVDFARRLQTGETLSTKTVTSKKVADGSDSTTTLLQDMAIDGTKVPVRLKAAGVAGDDHRVQFQTVTSVGNTFEDEIDVAIRED
jgi:hypothetical protein